jgi:Holliday junction resolvase RusA-like endonuclease
MRLTFSVYGVAPPKGNMKAFIPKGWQRAILTDSNKNIKQWTLLVADGASAAIQQLPEHERGPLTEGVRLTVMFYLPRPKKYQRAGVDPVHITKPDLDKLVRGVKDALTRIVWNDDSQVIELVTRKDYARLDDAPHVDIAVEPAWAYKPLPVPKASVGPALPLLPLEA